MHAFVHLISREELTPQRIEEIMAPQYQGNTDPFNRPQFDWDYYTVNDPIMFEKPEDCRAIIDLTGYCIAREWWDGNQWVDQNEQFDRFVKDRRNDWKGCYMYEIDIHW